MTRAERLDCTQFDRQLLTPDFSRGSPAPDPSNEKSETVILPRMSNSENIPRVLITNDDGIHAPGIALLETLAREISDDVWVVAPDGERSGAGHSISLTVPLRVRELDERRFEISGTPTDCVLMAVGQLMRDGPPTLILSGINSGANLAEDVTHSGTIAAAMEGTLLGIRSISLSQVRAVGVAANYAPAQRHALALIHQILELEDWPQGSFVNINFPDCPPDEVVGVRLTSQGRRPPGSYSIDARIDARNQPYYWIKIRHAPGNGRSQSDLEAISCNCIAVTPIAMDFTDHAWRAQLGSLAL
jgi:5'-nucleotidase